MALEGIKFSLDEAYKELGLSPGASPEDVKSTYRKKVLELHPDRAVDEADREKRQEGIRRLNRAREVIESGGDTTVRPSPPSHTYHDERHWDKFRSKYGPKPSGNYTDADLRRFAKDVLDKSLLQIIYRVNVNYVPMDSWTVSGGKYTYYRPFGSKRNTRRMPDDIDEDKLYNAMKSFGKGKIFDMVVKDKEAWITWEQPRDYVSVSFEEIKKKPKKQPGVGMKPEDVRTYMRTNGLDIVAGGTKYAYWGIRGSREKLGVFIRESKKTLRLVKRAKLEYTRGIQDIPLYNEFYFGKLTTKIMDALINAVKRRD